MRAASLPGLRCEPFHGLADRIAQIAATDEPAFQLQHRHAEPGQRVFLVLAAQVTAQQAQAGVEVGNAPEHAGGIGGIDPEHAVQRGLHHAGLGMARLGDAADLVEGLRQSGQGQDAFGKGVAQAACSAILRSRGASVAAMTAPPRQMSPSYSTTDWPGVTARCGRANATSSRPSSLTVTEQGSSTCR